MVRPVIIKTDCEKCGTTWIRFNVETETDDYIPKEIIDLNKENITKSHQGHNIEKFHVFIDKAAEQIIHYDPLRSKEKPWEE